MTAIQTLTDLGPIGLWSRATEALTPAEARQLARRYEDRGVTVVWIPEGLGHEAMTHASLLLDATERLGVATGIASIWARDAYAAYAGTRLLRAAHDDRFVLGVGVSHRLVVDGLRGQSYGPPVASLAGYLDRIDELEATGEPCGPRVIAALGPRMLDLAADRGVGVITYLTTVEHTASARETLGAGHLSVHLPAVVGDPATARAVARDYLATYLALENYRTSFARLGFTDDDLEGGGSDSLLDSLVAHGTVEDVAAACERRWDAGADHVALQPLDTSTMDVVLAGGLMS